MLGERDQLGLVPSLLDTRPPAFAEGIPGWQPSWDSLVLPRGWQSPHASPCPPAVGPPLR